MNHESERRLSALMTRSPPGRARLAHPTYPKLHHDLHRGRHGTWRTSSEQATATQASPQLGPQLSASRARFALTSCATIGPDHGSDGTTGDRIYDSIAQDWHHYLRCSLISQPSGANLTFESRLTSHANQMSNSKARTTRHPCRFCNRDRSVDRENFAAGAVPA